MPQESFQKALRSLEIGVDGWSLPKRWKRRTKQQLEYEMRVPNPERMLVIKQVWLTGANIPIQPLSPPDPVSVID